jgi:DNA-binding MarR family transcriptional regulator
VAFPRISEPAQGSISDAIGNWHGKQTASRDRACSHATQSIDPGTLADNRAYAYYLLGSIIMTKEQKPHQPQNLCCATAMRKASRRLSQLYDDAIDKSGLKTTQFAILAELERRAKEPPTMAELAQALVMDRSALGHNLRPLERDGLIALEESDADRRRRHVVTTTQGKAKCREARKHWQKAQDRFDAVFGKAKAASLRAILLEIAYDERLASLKD